MMWSVCRSVHATWSLKSWNLPKMSPTAFHPSTPTCRDWPAAIDHRCINNPPPVRADVPRTLPPLRTPSLEHLPSQADECKTLAYDLHVGLELSQRPRSCNDLSLFSDFSISIYESIQEIYKHNKLGQRRHSRFCSKGGKPIVPFVRRTHNAVR